MKTFPWKKFELRCTLPAQEVKRRISAATGPDNKEFVGTFTGDAFSMHNHSKFPPAVKGHVETAGEGSSIKGLVVQDGKLTLAELALLVVIAIAAAIFFPSLMSDGPHIAGLIFGVIILYLIGFYAEVEQARNFLCEVLGEEEATE